MRMRGLAILAVILFVAGVAQAKDYEVTKKAGEYNVVVKIDKNPPVVGDNNVTIGIKDASDKYVSDARVLLEYSMPAMPGMPAMNYKADAVAKGNEYTAKMNLSMSGSWNITVKITRAGKTSSMKFTVDAK
jgi:hypothetical protein